MRIAVEGCCHGDLDRIYATIERLNTTFPDNEKIELLLCCGDFQAIRNARDMQSLACPQKYRELKDFHRYWKGEKMAPVLTVFIGGNHEASDYMLDL